MAERPTVRTKRLILRPFAADDAPEVARLAADRAISDNTLMIPYPYELHHAQEWLATHQEAFDTGRAVIFAITLEEGGTLVGAVGLHLEPEHARAELGYWVGAPFWSRGFAGEAAAAAVQWGFESTSVNRVYAHVYARNPASVRVLLKAGFRYEGLLREHYRKGERFEDSLVFGLLRRDFEALPSRAGGERRGGPLARPR